MPSARLAAQKYRTAQSLHRGAHKARNFLRAGKEITGFSTT
jgi:hypothetical protein